MFFICCAQPPSFIRKAIVHFRVHRTRMPGIRKIRLRLDRLHRHLQSCASNIAFKRLSASAGPCARSGRSQRPAAAHRRGSRCGWEYAGRSAPRAAAWTQPRYAERCRGFRCDRGARRRNAPPRRGLPPRCTRISRSSQARGETITLNTVWRVPCEPLPEECPAPRPAARCRRQSLPTSDPSLLRSFPARGGRKSMLAYWFHFTCRA